MMIMTFMMLAVWLALMLFALFMTFRTDDLETSRHWGIMGMLYIIAALVVMQDLK